ncbi:MAG TPA: class I SAM-dependent methyltransferase [Candidatus Angelobacter sp.]|nr:class I SAM-dependent methyltransferase [Candidatus Angelobacter sp.]
MSSLRQLQNNWESLAQADPFWAICSDPERRQARWNRKEFFATGEHEIECVLHYVDSLGVAIDRGAPALDFGCGVGRLTRALAAHFPECHGVDISPTMVRLAEDFNHDLPRCKFLVNERHDLRCFERDYFGFVYSSIVLQHIPPRHSRRYLEEMARVTKPGGVLVFQVLDDLLAGFVLRLRQKIGIRRNLRRLVSRNNGHGSIDLYWLAEAQVRRVLHAAGARVIDVRYTNSADPAFDGNLQYLQHGPASGWVSKQYCVVKDQVGGKGTERT